MKLKKYQKIKLKSLLAKKPEELTEAEKAELTSLKALADAEKFDATKYNPDEDDSEDTLTDEELQSIVQNTLAKTLEDKGLSSEKLLEEIRKSFEGGIKAEQIDEIVKKHVGQSVDMKALAEEVKKSIPKGISGEEIETKMKTLFEEFSKSIRKEPKMEHPSYIDFPIAHRSGNLSVAQKQLLNVCLASSGCPDLKDSDRPKHMNEGITEAQLKRAEANGARLVNQTKREARYGTKAITTGGTGSGAELMDTDISSDLLSRLYMESDLAARLIAREMDMPTNPFELPMTTTRVQFRTANERQAGIENSPGTSKPILNAKKLIGEAEYSYEADEDSIVAMLPLIQANMASGAADAFEQVVINGDTTATHQDTDIDVVSRHAAKLFNGLRKYALAVGDLTLSLATGGITADNIKALRKRLGKYGMRPQDLLLVAGPLGYNDLVGLKETLTMAEVGGSARILTGNAPSIFGIPIIPSSACREDLNASGVYDGSTTTKGSILLFHLPSWIVGVRRGFTVEVETDKRAQTNYVVASFRRDFIPQETPSATESMVAIGNNYNAM